MGRKGPISHTFLFQGKGGDPPTLQCSSISPWPQGGLSMGLGTCTDGKYEDWMTPGCHTLFPHWPCWDSSCILFPRTTSVLTILCCRASQDTCWLRSTAGTGLMNTLYQGEGLAGGPRTDEEAKAVDNPGQLWILGNSRGLGINCSLLWKDANSGEQHHSNGNY